MKQSVGIRREDKEWESRVPLTPENVKELVHNGIPFVVQKSHKRAFPDAQYEETGASISEALSSCRIILGIKEIPLELLEKDKIYIFFSHTVKGQAYNMPMLKRIMELGCTLIDYEKIADETGKRLIFFGNYAGLAGMVDTLWALGKRLDWEGIRNPFIKLKQCYQYKNLETVKEALRDTGEVIKAEGIPPVISPFVCGFAGYGNVSVGAQEIFDLLPVIQISPQELPKLFRQRELPLNHLYKVVFKEEHMVLPKASHMKFDLQDYYDYPEKYQSIFETYIPYLTVLVNCIYWTDQYPRLLTKSYLKGAYRSLPLRVIGDISCDINGAIEFTEKSTKCDNPVFIYDPVEDKIFDGYKGRGITVMAIDNLPCELPIEASGFFGNILKKFLPEIALADYSVDFEGLNLSPAIKDAIIVYRGELVPDYKYLEKYLNLL